MERCGSHQIPFFEKCDNKMILDANVEACKPQYNNITHCSHEGCVGGRNFLHNIGDIDAVGRRYLFKYVG